MIRERYTAVGLEVTACAINAVRILRTPKDLRIVQAVHLPLPEGTVEGGNVKVPVAVGRVLMDVRRKCGILPFHKTVLTVSGLTDLIQLLDMPRYMPENITHYVENEMKQYVAVSGKGILVDYRRINHLGRDPGNLLSVAIECQRISDVVGLCQRSRYNIEHVEPTLLATIRAISHQRMDDFFGRYILLIVLHDRYLDLCVLRCGRLDYIRRHNRDPQWSRVQREEQLITQIETMIQYYDIEVLDQPADWDIKIVCNESVTLAESFAQQVLDRYPRLAVEHIRSEGCLSHLKMACDDTVNPEHVSLTAVGSALCLLEDQTLAPRLSLMPKPIRKAKRLRQSARMAMAFLLVVLMLVLLGDVTIRRRIDEIHDRMAIYDSDRSMEQTVQLVTRHQTMHQQIEVMSRTCGQITGLLEDHPQIDWSAFLTDLQAQAPQTLCVTQCQQSNANTVMIRGLSMTYAAIHSFMDRLSHTETIEKCKLVHAQRQQDDQAFMVGFQLFCQLTLKGSL